MRMRWLRIMVLLTMLLSLVPISTVSAAPLESPPVAIEVEPELQAQLQADGAAGYLIYFREKADLSAAYNMNWHARGEYVANALQQTADRTQKAVRAYLDAQGADYQAFWIDNVIVVNSSSLNTFNALTTNFPEIEALRARRHPVLYEPVDINPSSAAIQAVESNLTHIGADQVWGMGFTGSGLVVANIDTGVRYTHDALVNQYRGNMGSGTFDHNYNWWDPYSNSTAPHDVHNHGSHTMGTMVGDDGGANQIGMAPGAQWMACMGFNPSATDAGLLECGQFMAAPWDLTGANPDPDMRPHVVNNSWGDCGRAYDPWYEGVLNAWHAAGVYPSFSNGNAGNCGYSYPPGLNTVGNPARSGNVTGVGATGTSNGAYATYSNWGPTDDPDTVNPNGYPYLKPQVVAPGTNRSAYGTGSDSTYGGMSGTSMASPHVAGLIALIWSAAPCLVGDYATTETIIEQTATPIPYDTGGSPPPGPGNVPNYATGWGEINALAAVELAVASCGDSIINGTVTDAGTGDPIEGVTVTATSVDQTATATSDASGLFELMVYSGTYTLEAAVFGYETAVIPGVVAVTGMTTTQDIALTMLPSYTISGVVSDGENGWPLYASITIPGYPWGAIWTDPATGAYSVTLPEGGTYTFEVEAWLEGYTPASVAVGPLAGDVTQDFPLDADLDMCAAPGYGWTNGLIQDFEGEFPPPGWTVVNNGGTCTWVGNDPGARGNLTGADGAFAIADSDDCGIGTTMNTDLISPIFDASGMATVILEFAYDYYHLGTGSALVDISADGGGTWTNVATWTASSRGPQTFSQDVSALAAGSPTVQVRFRYLAPGWYWWWEVDHVVVGDPVCTAPDEGGLVVGNVYDAPTGGDLPGAMVVNDSGHETVVVATDDPNVGDAFYTLFSPPGDHVFTASKPAYADDVQTVAVVDAGAVVQDFYLDSGYIEVTPDGVEVTLQAGENAKEYLNLENLGSAAADFAIIEQAGGYIPAGLLASPGKPDGDRSLELAVGKTDGQGPAADAWQPNGAVTLVVDDGSSEDAIGLTAGGQFIWLNRFTPDPSEFPFTLEEVHMLFRDSATVGEAIEIVIWEDIDGDGDPGTGATLRSAEMFDVQANDAATWSVYELGSPVYFAGPGDVLIGAVNRDNVGTHPAAIDTTASQGRSWVGIYSGDPPEPPTLPPDSGWGTIDSMGFAGNWMIRGAGTTGFGGDDAIPWLTETPITGTVGVGENKSVMLTFDASGAAANQPGTYYGALRVSTNTPYPDATVPVTMNVMAPATWGKLEGAVTGLGYCDGDPAPLAGAAVMVESGVGMVWNLETDAAGAYELWVDEMYSPLTITVSADEHLPATASGVAIVGETTTVQDFDLRWAAPCVGSDPDMVHVTVELGGTTSSSLLVTNDGAAGTSFNLTERNDGFAMTALPTTTPVVTGKSNPAWAETSEGVVAPAVTPPASGAALDFGAAWETMAPIPSARVFNAVVADSMGYIYVIGGTSDAGGLSPTDTVFRYNTATDAWDTMANMPSALDSIDGVEINGKIYIPGDATTANTFVYDIAADSWSTLATTGGYTARSQYQVVAIDADLYVLGGIVAASSASTTEVWVLDTTTGAWTAGVPMLKSRTSFSAGAIDGNIYVAGGVLFPGFTPDMTAEMFDGSSWSYVAGVPNGGGAYTRWSYNADGVGADGLWLAAGRRDADWTVLNHAGYYDPVTDTWTDSPTIPTLAQPRVYMEGDVASDGYFYVIGGRDGAGSVVYATNERLEVGYAGPSAPTGLPWLTETPTSGAVGADDTFAVALDFEATAAVTVTVPGDYFGTLFINSNDPVHNSVGVPIQMTVTPPPTWAKVNGTVTSLGYCDADPAPVADVDVSIEATDGTTWTVMTDDAGYYQLWLDAAHGDVTVDVAPPEHESGSALVTVTAGVTSTQDFDLRWLVPCVASDPDFLQATLALGDTATDTLEITNDGAADLNFTFSELNGGYMVTQIPLFEGLGLRTEGVPQRLGETAQRAAPSAMAPTADVIQDGGFEDGTPNSFWDEFSTNFGTPICDLGSCGTGTGTGPRTGDFWTWFGGIGAYEEGYVEQDVTIPSGMATLSFWLEQIVCGADTDYMVAAIDGDVVFETDGTSPICGVLGYSEVVVDVSDYADGGVHTVTFYSESDSGSNIFIDDVVLNVEAGAGGAIPWLLETPISGVVPAGGSLTVDVDFEATDAVSVTLPGVYFGTLYLESDDPVNDKIAVPVEMNVTPPASWGQAVGHVDSMGYCDADPAPVAYPQLVFESWTQTSGTVVVNELLAEGFEGAFPPSGWTKAMTGDAADPGFVQTSSRFYTGSYAAYHDDNNLTTSATSWLITPQVSIPAGGATLEFWQNVNYASWAEYHGLWISTTGNDPADFSEEVDLGTGTEDTWTMVSRSLNAYAGQDIYIAFRYEGDFADEWYLDDVRVYEEYGDVLPVSYTIIGDANGDYAAWLPGDTYTVTVTAPEQLAAQEIVTVTASGIVTTDFTLRLDAPCGSVAPDAIADTLAMGESATHVVTLDNAGAGALDFEWIEYAEMLTLSELYEPQVAQVERLVTIGDNVLAANPNPAQSAPAAPGLPDVPAGAVMLTHSLSQAVMAGNSVACGAGGIHADNSYIRVFDLAAFGIPAYFEVQSVDIGIETALSGAGGVQPAGIYLYTLNGDLSWANMTLIGYTEFDIADQDLTVINVPVTGMAPAGSVLVVELFTPDGSGDSHSFYAGSNDLGQTGPTYLAAAACGVPEPTNVADLGFPEMQLVMNVTGLTPEIVDVPWLIEDPITGTVAPDGSMTIDFTLDADQVLGPGVYYATASAQTNDPVEERFPVSVVMTVTLPATYGEIAGTVMGLGPCDDPATAAPLAGADVIIESATRTWTLTTAADGTYALNLDAANSPLTITVMAADFVGEMATGVTVAAGATTVQDFELRADAPCYGGIAPADAHVTLPMGATDTLALTLSNVGAGALTWELTEADAGFSVMAGEDILVVSEDTDAANAVELALGTLGYTFLRVTASTFTGMNVADLLAYQAVIYVGSVSSGSEDTAAVAYLDAGGHLIVADNDYAYFYCDGGVIGGALLGPNYLQCHYISDSGSDGIITGLDIMSGITADISDDPYPDDMTLFGPDAVGIFQAPSGNLAGLRIAREGYMAILLNWDYNHIGAGAAGDPEELAIMERAMNWLSGGGGGVPWLDESPTDGVVAPDDTSGITLDFDAGVPEVTQPGDYYATLTVTTDDPLAPEVIVPVTMTVEPPATWGKLEGVVESLGYCDVNPAPIEGAMVFIESGTGMTWTLTTDVNGMYGVWMDAAHSPLTVTVSYEAGHEPQVITGVAISAGNTTTLDVSLRSFEPCVAWAQDGVQVSLEMDEAATIGVNLLNNGALGTPFSLGEIDMGFSPMLTAITGSGGPDAFGYTFADSDEAVGPAFDYIDITALGAPLGLGDDEAVAVPLGFTFNYYGTSYTEVYVSSNGLLAFGAPVTNFVNAPTMPDPALPNNIAAVLWDDLMPGADSEIYTRSFERCPYGAGACLVVQYLGYEYAGGGAAGNFEAILFRNGSILMQYADAGEQAGASATIGIENPFGLDGLLYAANAADAIADGLAVCFAYPGQPADCVATDIPWLELNPIEGVLGPDSILPIDFHFDTNVPEVAEPGDYYGLVTLYSDDRQAPYQVLPVTLTVRAPSSWGRVEGTVTGWNHCDMSAFPMENSSVLIEADDGTSWALFTASDGAYGQSLDAGKGPFTITVMHDGYVTAQVANVMVAMGGTTTVDIELHMDAPCFSVSPTSLAITLTQGHTGMRELMLHNDGEHMLEISEVQDETWATADMTSGMVAPHSMHMMEVMFDAAGMSIGDHPGVIMIMSNDPGYPEMTVPITLTVVTPTLLVDVTADPADQVVPGDEIMFTITVTNTSDGPLDVDLLNDIPANTSYVIGSATNGLMHTEGMGDDYLSWSGAIDADGVEVFTFSVRVDMGYAPGEIVNTVDVDFAGQAASAMVAVPVVMPTLLVDVTAAPDESVPGGVIDFTITVTNTSDSALEIDLNNDIPANTSYVTGSATNGLMYGEGMGGAYMSWHGMLGAGAVEVFTFSVRVDIGYAPGEIVNTVDVDYLDETASAMVAVPVVVPTLGVVMTVDPADHTVPGGVLNYVITLTNTTGEALSVDLRDDIPDHASYVTGSAAGGLAYVEAMGDSYMSWSGVVGAGGTAVFSFSVQVDLMYRTGDITNRVDVDFATESAFAEVTVPVRMYFIFLPLVAR